MKQLLASLRSSQPARLVCRLLGVWAAIAWLLGCRLPLPSEALVRHVIDGDTVELADGRLVRYVGMNAPEVRRRHDNRWVVDPQPMGPEATALNRQLVEGRRVRLEYDVQTTDRFGRLLAYVYVDERFVNAELVCAGLAEPMTISPNVKHAEVFSRCAAEARRSALGLWRDPHRP